MGNNFPEIDDHPFSFNDILDYLAQNMDEPRLKEFEQHFQICDICQDIASDLTKIDFFNSFIKSHIKDHLTEDQFKRYFTNSLSKEERIAFEIHLKHCKYCTIAFNILTKHRDALYTNNISIDELIKDKHKLFLLSKRFFESKYSNEDISKFDTYWQIALEEYEWDKGEFESVSEDTFKHYKIAAYSQLIQNTSPEVPVLVIHCFLLLRIILLKYPNVLTKKELESVLKKNRITSKSVRKMLAEIWAFVSSSKIR